MYIRDVICTLARPLWELRGFKRVTLAPGASTNVTFALTEKELGFWNREQRHVVEPGEFRIDPGSFDPPPFRAVADHPAQTQHAADGYSRRDRQRLNALRGQHTSSVTR